MDPESNAAVFAANIIVGPSFFVLEPSTLERSIQHSNAPLDKNYMPGMSFFWLGRMAEKCITGGVDSEAHKFN